MGSKLLKLSFPEDAQDVYHLLKSKARPSLFVVEAIRFYQTHLNTQAPQQEISSQTSRDMSVEVESIVKDLVKKEVEKLKTELKKELSEITQPSQSGSQETVEAHQVGEINLDVVESLDAFDVAGAISAFEE